MSPLWVSDPKVCPFLDLAPEVHFRPDPSVVRTLCASDPRFPRITLNHPQMLSLALLEGQFLPGPSWDLLSWVRDVRETHPVCLGAAKLNYSLGLGAFCLNSFQCFAPTCMTHACVTSASVQPLYKGHRGQLFKIHSHQGSFQIPSSHPRVYAKLASGGPQLSPFPSHKWQG